MPSIVKRFASKLDRFVIRTLGTEWAGENNPPGDRLKAYVESDGTDFVVMSQDDGFYIYLGVEDEWLVNMRAEALVKLAGWVLWDYWAKGTWCGLRRKVWYASLHREVARLGVIPRPSPVGRPSIVLDRCAVGPDSGEFEADDDELVADLQPEYWQDSGKLKN